MVINEVNEEEIIVIRTLECDLCMRFDSIMITREEIEKRVSANSLQIGSHLIPHRDHLRIVYFDHFGIYLGDTISLNMNNSKSKNFDRELPILPTCKRGVLQKIQKHMLKRLIALSQNLCILGPSLAGKTSLTMYLETGMPERYSKRINHSPTLGKSVRRFKLGNSKLTVFDMGGQRDFWHGWSKSIANSEKIIFVVDGSANNINEIADGLKIVLKERKTNIPILILMNKMDLFIEGYISNFSSSSDFMNYVNDIDINNVWTLETSVFNGVCYNYGGEKEETPLAQVILDFLEFKIN